jgi:arsenical-resistance protein 2
MTEKPWHATYPSPRTTNPDSISREVLLGRLQGGDQPGRDFVLIDLRRNDHEGGTIRGSLNLPAQSLYRSLPTVYTMCKPAGVKLVIWYCGESHSKLRVPPDRRTGSSRGRGTRAAGWFADLIEDAGDVEMKSAILEGGITGWANAGEEYVQWMDEYDEETWKRGEKTKQ